MRWVQTGVILFALHNMFLNRCKLLWLQVRDWVLALSMDQQVEQSLSMRTCSNCGADTYSAALRCHECKTTSDLCIITGYPIPTGERTVVKGVDPPVFARKEDFNRFVNEFGHDPWSGNTQAAGF